MDFYPCYKILNFTNDYFFLKERQQKATTLSRFSQILFDSDCFLRYIQENIHLIEDNEEVN